ncbi:AAA family ATPase [Rhizobium leguminosarum]|uniref:AAA family ATPase n=1 Tax=Rhizobium leguminosarum TaxID=384 RepID=UPI003F9BACF5
MIEQISIDTVASYTGGAAILIQLRPINFIFGANGSGKTTISRVIAKPETYINSAITWTGGTPLECLVYNRDFVEENFTARMRGIFTLGHEDAETLRRIDDLKKEIDEILRTIRDRKHTLEGADGTGGKRKEHSELATVFQDACWKSKTQYEDRFREAFRGVLNSRANFAERMFGEFESNTATLKPLNELETRANTIFAEAKVRLERYSSLEASDGIALEADPILAKRVVGKEDVSISDMIKRLGNSDWVKQGLGYFRQNDDHCPFCQQATDDKFRRDLEDYFDESYQRDVEAISLLAIAYSEHSNGISRQLDHAVAVQVEDLDRTSLEQKAEVLRIKLALNIQHIARKKTEPSSKVELETVRQIVDEINAILADANEKVDEHNALIDNIVAERATLIAEIWRYIVEEAKITLEGYNTASRAVNNAIEGLTRGIAAKEQEKRDKSTALRELERQITSVQPTVNAINSLLGSFGFRNFKLATSGEGDRLYTVIRGDGSEARETLSEGEKTFIVFLYFYYLISGSVSESGMTNNRIVVIDDPVSSLDSDVLFIVSSLIRKLFARVLDQASTLKQIFVFTHNIYFHKEVTFDPKKQWQTKITFWVVRKKEDYSVIEGHAQNPIQTSYEMLWQEVRNENRSILTIQNTLRRILENYFTILGNMDKDDIVNEFAGQEQQICNSLFSWVNDGSHSALEDLYLACDAATVDRFLQVFKKIFEVSGHSAHYDMMIAPRQ